MIIRQTVDYIMEHPYLKDAIESYNKGNEKDLRHILNEIQTHVWLKTALCASRIYGNNKWCNAGEIRLLLREMPPPENLDFRLPIPLPKDTCIVVNITKRGKRKEVYNKMQLEINFSYMARAQ